MTSLATRLARPASTTVFERMSALARQTGAINLGQGFPDLPDPPELIAAAQAALVQRSNQYPPMRGLAELRSAIAAYYAREQGLAVTPEEIVVTSGATEALAAALLALVQPGDEVILVQPCYDAYQPLIERAGGTARFVNLTPPHWTLDTAALAAAITPATRGIVLNTPNNPVGALLDRQTLKAIGALCEAHDLWIVSDEVWEGTVLDGTPHASALAVPALRDRTVKVGSAGKIISLTGWKIGWAIAAPPLVDAVAARHQFLTFTTATPLQWAVAEGLALPTDWHASHRARYAHARARLVEGLAATGFAVLPASGTWFITIDLAASGLPADDEAISQALIEQAGVASIPVSAFYAEHAERGFLRLCFAKDDATLDEAVRRLTTYRQQAGGA